MPSNDMMGGRRTGFEVVGEPRVHGDKAIGAVLVGALEASEPVERWTHGFHTYPAGLHPDAAAKLVAAFPGSVLDPFCGGGTVLVEARAAGRRAVGRDLSNVALLVARGRTATPDDSTLTTFRSTARKLTEIARGAVDLPPDRILAAVEDWYAPHALWELESLRSGIETAPEAVRPLLWCCFSSTLIKVSWRRSDTSAQREKHRRPAGTTAILFHKKVRELARRLVSLREAVPPGTPEVDIARCDARALALDVQVHAAITSPPYPSTYDYLPLQHLRSVWLGLEAGSGEIGSRRSWREGAEGARRAWIADTRAWTASVALAIRPGGALVVVIGDGLSPAGSVDSAGATEAAARAAGLQPIARASVERRDHARSLTRWEHAFAYRKPE